MAETIKIIDPYDSYTPLPLDEGKGVYGQELLSSVQSLQVGFGSKVLRVDQDGLWMGAEDFASAPFSVDMDGNMTADSLDLSGYLQVGDSLTDLQPLIGDLSDIDNDLGTITAGNLIGLTVTGGTVQTSSSGARVVMNGTADALEIYDASRKRMYLDNDELVFINSSGTETASLTAGDYNLDIDLKTVGWCAVKFNNSSTISGFLVEDQSSNSVFYAGGGVGSNVVQIGQSGGTIPLNIYSSDINLNGSPISKCGDLDPESDKVSDMGSTSLRWDNIYCDDLDLADDIIMNNASGQTISMNAGIIDDVEDIFWDPYTSNPVQDGHMIYYDSGGTEGCRMQFGGSDFQFDASAV